MTESVRARVGGTVEVRFTNSSSIIARDGVQLRVSARSKVRFRARLSAKVVIRVRLKSGIGARDTIGVGFRARVEVRAQLEVNVRIKASATAWVQPRMSHTLGCRRCRCTRGPWEAPCLWLPAPTSKARARGRARVFDDKWPLAEEIQQCGQNKDKTVLSNDLNVQDRVRSRLGFKSLFTRGEVCQDARRKAVPQPVLSTPSHKLNSHLAHCKKVQASIVALQTRVRSEARRRDTIWAWARVEMETVAQPLTVTITGHH